jgi:CRISPR-associated protein Cas1
MTDLYISKKGKITKSDEHLIFHDIEGNETRILPSKINQILLYDNISITGEAFTILAKNKIPLSIKTYNGIDNVLIQYENSKNVFLRQSQYRTVDCEERCLKIAKSIVAGKIQNQLTFLQRIKRSDTDMVENQESISFIANELKQNLFKIKRCKSLNILRGIEGFSSKLYFSVFGLHIKPSWADFKSRSKNPPKSNVNAVLSFLYSLLEQEITFAAQSKGLDVMIGTLHKLSYGRNSLSCDLMEEFRTPIVDTLCCHLFNDSIMNEEDFEERNGGVYLIKTGLKKIICAFEEKLEKSIKYEEKYLTYRELIFDQIEKYKKMIMNQEEIYEPYKHK